MTSGRTADRRRDVRRPAAELVRLRAARLRPGLDAVVIDLSSGGALVETAARLHPRMKTVLQLTAGACEVRAAGEVVRAWVSAVPPGGGILYRGALRFDRPTVLPTEDLQGACGPAGAAGRRRRP